MNYLFTCGGTAGHINPAIAIADALRAEDPHCGILFVGAAGKMETDLVPKAGYDIRTVEITSVSRSVSLEGLRHNMHTMQNVFRSEHAAREILTAFQPDIVIGTGGYVCYPVIDTASRLGIPSLVHESNAQPGLTTRMLAHKVSAVLVGMPAAAANYPAGTNVICTGTPVRESFFVLSRSQARSKLGLSEGVPLLLSVWGSLGATAVNGTIADMICLAGPDPAFRMIHSAGRRGYEDMNARLSARFPDYAAHGYDVRPYIYDMDTVMAAADLIVCRAGASTIAELTSLGRAAVFVPSPNVAENHQEKNARVPAEAGGARLILESELTAKGLLDTVNELFADRASLSAMESAMAALGSRDALHQIVSLVHKYEKKA